MSEWIKTKSKMIPKYTIFQKVYKNRGLRATIMKNLMDTRLLTIWKKLCTTMGVSGKRKNYSKAK